MQEHAVLDVVPLGIDGDTALRHSCKVCFCCACSIQIPSQEGIPGRGAYWRIRYEIIVFRYVCFICDFIASGDFVSRTVFFLFITVAGQVYAVHEIDDIFVACVIAINISCIAVAPDSIQLCSGTVICFRRICIPAFCKADKFDIVFGFSKEGILCVYAFILYETKSVIGSLRCLSFTCFNIVPDSFCSTVRNIQMERDVGRGHYIDKYKYF